MTVNVEQSEAWNGNEGQAWAAHQDRHDAALRSFNVALAEAAAISETDHVLDVGCGCGESTRAAARSATRGSALGIDLSAPMLERARERAAEEQLTNVSFVQGDAQVHEFDRGEYDIAISRFGSMFFADPVAAFANIGAALQPDARLALVVWMPLDQNEWLSVIREALAMGRTLPAPQAGSPGPFGLADPGWGQTMLEAAGYTRVAFDEFRSEIAVGSDPDDAFGFVSELPPVVGMVDGLDDTDTAHAFDRLRAALTEHATPDGVRLGAAAWVVTARRV